MSPLLMYLTQAPEPRRRMSSLPGMPTVRPRATTESAPNEKSPLITEEAE
jgi:hypothetical protein